MDGDGLTQCMLVSEGPDLEKARNNGDTPEPGQALSMFQLMRVDGATPQPVPSSVSATAVALTLMSSLHGPLGKLGRKRASVWSRSKSPVIAESGDRRF